MIARWIQPPDGVVDKIRQSDNRAIAEFSGKRQIIPGKQLRQISPGFYEIIFSNDVCIVINKGVRKCIELQKNGNKDNNEWQDFL